MEAEKMKKVLALLLATMMLLATATGCGGKSASAASAGSQAAGSAGSQTSASAGSQTAASSAKKEITIGVIPYYARDDFYKDLETGVRSKCDELGVNLVYQDPDGDATKCLQILEDLESMHVDGICCCPVAQDAMIPQLQECIGAGIPVVTFDGLIKDSTAVTAAVQFDFSDCGTQLGKLIEKYVKENGQYDGSTKLKTAIIDLPKSTTVGVPIIDSCKKYLEDAGIIDVVAQQDGQADRNYAMGVMENILTANKGDIDLLIGFNYDACMGGVAAAEAYGLTDMVAFSQLWGEEAFKHLEDDDSMWKGGVAYSPVVMGETAVQTAYDIITGKSVDHDVFCDATLLTHDNINTFDWKSIIAARK
jgi:ribose transport system substrate-binding protein